MNKKGSKPILSICFTIMIVLLLAFPFQVFAQDETPATPTDPTVVSVETAADPTADPTVDVPEEPSGSLAGDTAVSGEPTLDASAVPAQATAESIVEATEETPAEGTAVPSVEVAVVVEALAKENLVLVDETGAQVPLVSETAAQAIASGDPWFDAGGGVIVGYSLTASCAPLVTECHQVTNPVQAAIDDDRSTGKDITIEGTYYEQITIVNKDVNLIGATTGGGLAAPGELTKNGEMDGTDLFGLVYIYGGTVNLLGLTIDGTGGYVDSPGNDIYAGVVFNNASGSVVTSNISNFVDGSESDQGVGICIYDSTNVTIEQNEISYNETGVLVNESEKVQIQNNVIHNISNDDEDTKTVGVDIQDSESIDVSNNDIHDQQYF
jgi:parallel beta-helix repeat protein